MTTSPASVNLMALPTRLISDLRQTTPVAMTCWHFGSHLDLERELLVGGQGLKRAADGLGNILNRVIGQFKDELASFDLRQIEYVIDQSEQVSAVTLKPFQYAHRLFWQLAVNAVRHQFGVAENGVERRAQLVAHVGKELRLVLARDFKLAALVLDFVEQAHILDGDHRLIGERLKSSICFSVKGRPLEVIDIDGLIGLPSSIGTPRILRYRLALLHVVQVYSGSAYTSDIWIVRRANAARAAAFPPVEGLLHPRVN